MILTSTTSVTSPASTAGIDSVIVTKMQTYLVRHIIVELNGCPFAPLNNLAALETLLRGVAELIKTEVMAQISHQFQPYGVTAMLIVGASHLSIHTWPEHGYASLDLVVCTDGFDLQAIVDYVKGMLQARSASFLEFRRGLIES